jgi:8-oxo-dGTP pyrophosphatase MutT (NUDIX family)
MNTPRWSPRVTVAAIVEVDGRYLMVEEETPEGLRLNQPAGHLEQGESPLQAVRREALEETGCHFEPEALVGIYLSRFQRPDRRQDVTYLRLAYCGRASAPDPTRTLDAGIVRTLWLDLHELQASQARHRSELVWRCVLDHQAGRRHPLDLVQAQESVFSPRR